MTDQAPARALLRVIPPPSANGGLHRTQGTVVETADGRRIPGITKLVLTALPDDVWRATIDCYVEVPNDFVVQLDDIGSTREALDFRLITDDELAAEVERRRDATKAAA